MSEAPDDVLSGLTRADVLAIAKRVHSDPDTASDEDVEILRAYAEKFETEQTRQ